MTQTPAWKLAVRLADSALPWAMRAARIVRDFVRLKLSDRAEDKLRGRTLESEPWVIDKLELSGSGLVVNGWAMPPASIFDSIPRFVVNERVPAELHVAESRPDVAKVFWQRLYAERSGFRLRAEGANLFPNGYLEIAYPNSASRLPRRLRQSYFVCDPDREAAMPSEEQRYRVIGDRDSLGFRLSGATDFMRIAKACAAFTGTRFEDVGTVLDWGCGCGRLARYAVKGRPAGILGCDIDAGNVAWCGANLAGRYSTCTIRPPLPYEEASIDLAYGVSVFTHFREPLQDLWLAELARVMKSGAFVLVTVHGRTAADFAGLVPLPYAALLKRIAGEGIVFAGENHQLRGAAEDEGEYVNVFHSQEYIRKHWSRWFEIVEIVPGYIFTHDLVVMRKR
jgi:SAM-dependent methyltransferase